MTAPVAAGHGSGAQGPTDGSVDPAAAADAVADVGLGDGLDVVLVDGELRPAAAGATYPTSSPTTAEVLGQAADGGAADIDAAVAAARRAYDQTDWVDDHAFRAHCLRQLRDALVEEADALRRLTIAEVGAPRFLTSGAHLEAPVADLGWFADLAERYDRWEEDLGEARPMGVRSQRTVLRRGAGVVGAVTPWNFPHQINLAKVGPALAAGCTVVLKPAPETPWCAAALARLAAERTDLPPGVLNVVTSSDHAVGAQLVADPRVDVVSFTGSTSTGRRVMASAAEHITRVFLELGGKSAFVVLDDADIVGACGLAGFTAATHAGQGCALTTRLLLPRAHFDEGVEAAAATMASLGCGDPDDPGTVCGPVISERQRDRVEGYLRLAVEEGGRFAAGGGRPADRHRGWWIEPTLVVGLDNAARVAREEIFGPVLVAIPHDGDDHAVAVANDSPYGLSASVASGDTDRAWSVARRIRSGTVSINGGVWYGGDVPFGGVKQSGIGREMGVAGFEEYLELTSVAEGVR